MVIKKALCLSTYEAYYQFSLPYQIVQHILAQDEGFWQIYWETMESQK